MKTMQLTPLGDGAVLASFSLKNDFATLDKVARIARAFAGSSLPGVTDIVSACTTITIHYDPARVPAGAGSPCDRVLAWVETAAAAAGSKKTKAVREITLPVCYGGEHGPDMADVAKHTKLSEAEVIRLHSKTVYRVAAVGFAPGFPYLLGLPERLNTPRRATPRMVVPAGSVGIGGAQTGVYPLTTPGGWCLIGRTPLRLFRPENETAPTLLEAGDMVRLVAITSKQWDQQVEQSVPLHQAKVSKQAAVLEVMKAGALTTIQDMGREGWQQHGITAGGAMDRRAARVANLLLGNAEDDPLLEATLVGPELRFLRDTWIAVTGAEVKGVAGWRPLRVSAGQTISLVELTHGARVYVAVAGGFDVPRVLGGAGTLLRARIGGWNGRALQVSDRLAARPTILDTKGDWSAAMEFRTVGAGAVTVRFVRGTQWDWFDSASQKALVEKPFLVTTQSDRMGMRLSGPALKLKQERELVSEGVGFGSVQVPSDGQPIVLMADRQTIGGYPKIAHVIAVDLPLLAQVRAGGKVTFVETSIATAQALYLEQEKSLAMFRTGVKARLG